MILYFPKPELRSKKMFRSDISLPKLTKKHHFFGEGFPSNRRVVGWEFPIPRCHGNFWPTCSPRNSILVPNNGGFPKNQKKAGEIFVFFLYLMFGETLEIDTSLYGIMTPPKSLKTQGGPLPVWELQPLMNGRK